MWLTKKQIKKIGFKYAGKDILVSDKAVFYNPAEIQIGDYSRIDDFVTISARVLIGKYVHIGCYSYIVGRGMAVFSDYSGISGRVSVYTSSDPYNGLYMTNPCVPDEKNGSKLKDTKHRAVYLGTHAVVGSGSVILPGSVLEDGCAVGALSLVIGDVPSLTIFAGSPAKQIGIRSSHIFELEKELNK